MKKKNTNKHRLLLFRHLKLLLALLERKPLKKLLCVEEVKNTHTMCVLLGHFPLQAIFGHPFKAKGETPQDVIGIRILPPFFN